MSLIRRSMLPSFLFSAPPLAKAPKDPEVREWLAKSLGATAYPDSMKLAARLIEKALHRRSEELDLSSLQPVTLREVPASLLTRLSATVRLLKLPERCSPDLADRWGRELKDARITPERLWTTQTSAPRGISALPHGAPRRPSWADTPPVMIIPIDPAESSRAQEPPVYDVPPSRRGGDYDLPRPIVSDYDVPPRHPKGAANAIAGYVNMSDLSGYVAHQPGSTGSAATSGIDSPYDNTAPISREAWNDASSDSRSTGRGAPTRMASAAERADIRRQRELLDRTSVSTLAGKQDLMLGAAGAMKLPRLWLRAHAPLEGPDARCRVLDADANTLADALKGIHAGQLPSHVGKSLVTAQRLLAGREPNKPLDLTADDVLHLDRALNAVQVLVANAAPDGAVPALPRRNRSPGG